MVGDIAGPVDVSRAGAAALVDQDPVVLGHGCARDGRHLGIDPHADDGEVAGDPIPVGQHHRLQPLGSLERGDLRSGQQPDAVSAVDPADQLAETIDRHFTGQSDLQIVAVDLEPLGDAVKWEESRGGALFPHIYGTPLTLDVVLAYGPLEYEPDGSIKLPVAG